MELCVNRTENLKFAELMWMMKKDKDTSLLLQKTLCKDLMKWLEKPVGSQ